MGDWSEQKEEIQRLTCCLTSYSSRPSSMNLAMRSCCCFASSRYDDSSFANLHGPQNRKRRAKRESVCLRVCCSIDQRSATNDIQMASEAGKENQARKPPEEEDSGLESR